MSTNTKLNIQNWNSWFLLPLSHSVNSITICWVAWAKSMSSFILLCPSLPTSNLQCCWCTSKAYLDPFTSLHLHYSIISYLDDYRSLWVGLLALPCYLYLSFYMSPPQKGLPWLPTLINSLLCFNSPYGTYYQWMYKSISVSSPFILTRM